MNPASRLSLLKPSPIRAITDGTPQGATPLGTAKRAIETPGDGAPETGDLAAALQASGGNRQIAAERLGISRTTLWRRMKNLPASRQPTVPE